MPYIPLADRGQSLDSVGRAHFFGDPRESHEGAVADTDAASRKLGDSRSSNVADSVASPI